MKELENEIIDNKSVVKIPVKAEKEDALTVALIKEINEGKNPFASIVDKPEWRDEEEEKSIYSLEVNKTKYENYLFPGKDFEGVYSENAIREYWEQALSEINEYGHRVADYYTFLDRFYAEVDGKKFNIRDKMKEEKPKEDAGFATKAYILHAFTQGNVKISVVNSDGTEATFARIPRNDEELYTVKKDMAYDESKYKDILEKFSNYKLKGNYKAYSDPDALTNIDKYANSRLQERAYEDFKIDFEEWFSFAKNNSPNPYADMIIKGISGYENGISVADYAKIMADNAKDVSNFAASMHIKDMCRYIILHALTNPGLEITYIPRFFEFTKDGAVPKDTRKDAIYFSGKYGIETEASREYKKKLEEATAQNKVIDELITAINNTDITSINELAINNSDKLKDKFWIRGYFSTFDASLATMENLTAAAARFDDIFKDVMKEEPAFFDKLMIYSEGDRKMSFNDFYTQVSSSPKFKAPIDIKASETLFKKAMVLNILCTKRKLGYVNGLYTKEFKKVGPSALQRARKNQVKLRRAFNNSFLSSKPVFEPSINSKDRYNKRLKPDEMTEQEFAEVSKAFETLFKSFARKSGKDMDVLLENMEFKADTDLEFENVYSYIDTVFYGENLTPQQRTLYAKAYIVHALADPRESIRYKQPLVDPDTGEVLEGGTEDDLYLNMNFNYIPDNYKTVENNQKFVPNKVDDKKLFEESNEKNQQAWNEEQSYNHRKVVFNDTKEVLDLISSVNDDAAMGVSFNQGEKAGKFMDAEELTSLSDAELDEAEKAFDETFKDLIAYDAKIKSFRHNKPTTDYSDIGDLFVSGFETGDYKKLYELRVDIFKHLDNKGLNNKNNIAEYNKAYEKYMKAYIMRAITVKDDSLIYNPMVRESDGLNEILRYDWRSYPYLAPYMDILNPRKITLDDIYKPVEDKYERKGVEAWADKKENVELKDARRNTHIAGKNYNVRPFENIVEEGNDEIEEIDDEELNDNEWEAKEDQKAKEAEEQRLAKEAEEQEELEYHLSHDMYGNELPPEEVEFNKREYEIYHGDMVGEEYEQALRQLEVDREAYKQKQIDAANKANQERINRQKDEEERKWNDPIEVGKMRDEAEIELRSATLAVEGYVEKNNDVLYKPNIKERYDELKNLRDTAREKLDRINARIQELIPKPPVNGPQPVPDIKLEEKVQPQPVNNQVEKEHAINPEVKEQNVNESKEELNAINNDLDNLDGAELIPDIELEANENNKEEQPKVEKLSIKPYIVDQEVAELPIVELGVINGELSPVDKAERLKMAYDNARTIEDKVNFMVDLIAYVKTFTGLGQFSNQEMNAFEEIKTSFMNDYIINASDLFRENTIKAIGKVNMDINITLKREMDKEFNQHPEFAKEGNAGYNKAYYLAANGSASGARLSGVTSLLAEAKAAISDKVVGQEVDVWSISGGQTYLKDTNLSLEAKADVMKLIFLNGDEDSRAGIQDWIASDAPALIQVRKDGISSRIRSDFYHKHLNKTNYVEEKNRRSRVERNRRQKTSRLYANYFRWDEEEGGYQGNPLSDEELKNVVLDLGLRLDKDTDNTIAAQSKFMRVQENKDLYNNSIGTDRTPTLNNVYTLWVMGTHPEIDINEFTRVEEYPELVNEFMEFCRDNPLKKAKDKDSFKKATEKWADILYNGTERLKNLKMPDIDYSNPQQVKAHMLFLYKIRGLIIDFSQEKDDLFGKGHGMNGKRIAQDHLGNKKYNDMLVFWDNMQQLFESFNVGYVQTKFVLSSENTIQLISKAFKIAVGRAMMKSAMMEAPKRSLENFIRFSGDKGLYYMKLVDAITSMEDYGVQKPEFEKIAKITASEALDYLRGKNKGVFENKVQKIIEALAPRFKTENILHENTSAGSKFIDEIDFGDAREKILNLPDNAQATIDFLNSDNKIMGIMGYDEGVYPIEWLDTLMNTLFSENFSRVIHEAGFKKSEMFLIDGNSVASLWGAKYAHLPETVRERCYQLEVMKRIAKGESEIKVKNISIGKSGKLEVMGDMTLFKPYQFMQDLKRSYDVYTTYSDQLKTYLNRIKSKLRSTHHSVDPNVLESEIGKIGSDYFKDMESSLNQAIKALDNSNLTLDQIEEKLQNFNNAADTYYKNRRNLVFKKQSDEGQIRFDMSKQAKEEMPDMIATFREVARGLKCDLQYSGDNTFSDMKMFQYKQAFTKKYIKAQRKEIYKLEGVGLIDGEMDYYLENAKSISHTRMVTFNTLKDGIKNMGKDYSKLMKIESSTDTDSYNMAIAHILKNEVSRIERQTRNIDLVSINNDLKKRFADGSIKREAERLSKNPVFLAVLKHSRENFHKEWNEIESKADISIDYMKNAMNEVGGSDIDASRFIMTGDIKGGKIPKGEDALRQQYDRLGDFVTKQILTDPANRVIVQAIEAEQMKYIEVLRTVTDSLKRKNILGRRDFNIADFRDKLQNETIKKSITDVVIREAGRNAASRVPETKKMKPMREVQGSRIN